MRVGLLELDSLGFYTNCVFPFFSSVIDSLFSTVVRQCVRSYCGL